MDNHNQEHVYDVNNIRGFLAGLLFGGLAGAGAMLLLAPQSGKQTRTQIQEKSIELRDQTVKTVEDTVAQARTKAQQITADVRDKAEELQQRGQEVLAEQKERLSAVVESGNAVVQGFLD